MHAKHRNGPGNGYRGSGMGMSGMAGSFRASPEGPMRGHRMYNSEYRSYNRGGYGRGGHSKHFQPAMPPTREADIFIEAGRLAVEYLVSKELLPTSALSGKYSDALGSHFGNFESFRSQKMETSDGRVSVHSRLGNAAPDSEQGRRRYSDDYVSLSSKMKGRKRSEFSKSDGADVRGRTGSLTNSSRSLQGNNRHDEEQPAAEDANNAGRNSSVGETNLDADSETNSNSGLVKVNRADMADAKDSSLSNEVPEPSDVEGQSLKEEAKIVEKSDGDTKASEVLLANDVHQNVDEKEELKASLKEVDAASNDHFYLLKQCKFAKLPTKPRSSLTNRGSRSHHLPINEDKNIAGRELEKEGSSSHGKDLGAASSSVCNDSSNQKQELECLDSKVVDFPSVENNVDLHQTKRPGECSGSGSKEPEKDDSLSSFGTSNSTLMENEKKRALDYDDIDDFKKFRQWILPLDMQSDFISQYSTQVATQPLVQEPGTSHHAIANEKSLDISLSPRVHSGFQFMEEKHLFPASFKTCDLNLNENHEADPTLVFPSSKQLGNVDLPIDIDLSISNTCTLPITTGSGSEVIDLEKGSAMEVQPFNPDGRGDSLFTGLDDANGISDGPDGYGLMISELLGNDGLNCSSVSTDLNSLHNQMVLPNTDGMLGDDDSIYMSLGEIPISFLRAWEQPNQEDYGKPF